MLYGWGKNDKQQISNCRSPIISLPKQIRLNVRVRSVAAGWSHSLCASEDGRVFSWGQGEDGQLGLGEEKSAENPTEIPESKSGEIFAI